MNQSTAQVSVVMAVYRNLDQLSATLASIQRQEGLTFEIILVDDGNTEEDKARIASIIEGQLNIRLITNQENEGLTCSLITGCESASSQYISRIDNGDLMLPRSRLKDQFQSLEDDKTLGIVGGGVEYVDLRGRNRYRWFNNSDPIRYKRGDGYSLSNYYFCHVTVMFRKDIYAQAGGFDPQRRVGQDTDLWPRMLQISDGLVSPALLAIATMQESSISVGSNRSQIKEKIRSLVRQGREDDHWLRGFFLIASRVPIELLKLAIPNRQRMQLSFRKNMDFAGKIPHGATSSLEKLAGYYSSLKLD